MTGTFASNTFLRSDCGYKHCVSSASDRAFTCDFVSFAFELCVGCGSMLSIEKGGSKEIEVW